MKKGIAPFVSIANRKVLSHASTKLLDDLVPQERPGDKSIQKINSVKGANQVHLKRMQYDFEANFNTMENDPRTFYHQYMNNACPKYTAADIESFALQSIMYEGTPRFQYFLGPFLSAMMKISDDTKFDIHLEHLTTIIKYFAMADPSVGPCFSKPKTIVVHGHFDATIAFGMEGRWSNSRGEYANQRRDTTKGNRLLSIYDFKKKKEFKSPSQYRAGLVTLKIYGKVDGWEKGYSHELADKNELLHDFFKVYEREGTIYLNDRLLLWKGRTVLAGHLILPKPIVTILKVGTAISKFMRGKGNEQND